MSKIIFPAKRPSRTKIVATLGPASDSDQVVSDLINAGVDVFRLNMAHGDTTEAQARLDRVRKISKELGIPVAVHADLAGPKMRLGEIPGGEYQCDPDVPVRFVRGTETKEPNTFTTTYEPLIDELQVGNKIMLADGTVALEVTKKEPDAVECQVILSGVIRSRQGVNLPGAKLSVKTLQPTDVTNAVWAMKAGVDFIGISFVRSHTTLLKLREFLLKIAKGNLERVPQLIAKIEKPEAIEPGTLEEIVRASDGIMVARGDLGVEVDIAQVAVIQKRIINMCRNMNKPVIVATQMLESMHHLTIPTRAEATDVANAILDGTDACMLSGETAVGEHPVEAVKMMHRIADETEKYIFSDLDTSGSLETNASRNANREKRLRKRFSTTGWWTTLSDQGTDDIADALGGAASALAETVRAKMIVVGTHSGRSAKEISNRRRRTMILGVSRHERSLRKMCLYWGVVPIVTPSKLVNKLVDSIIDSGKENGFLQEHDLILLVDSTKKVHHYNDVIKLQMVK